MNIFGSKSGHLKILILMATFGITQCSDGFGFPPLPPEVLIVLWRANEAILYFCNFRRFFEMGQAEGTVGLA